MAQTKRKRKTKHRGNQAGSIETRGRTSRPANRAEARKQIQQQRAHRRLDKINRPPTWRGATGRAAFAAGIFLFLIAFAFKQPLSSALPVAAGMFMLYIPMSYFTDVAMYKRRMRSAARRKEGS